MFGLEVFEAAAEDDRGFRTMPPRKAGFLFALLEAGTKPGVEMAEAAWRYFSSRPDGEALKWKQKLIGS